MTLILNGDTGLSDVDGSAATPAIRGTDSNTGIFFPAADTIGFSEGGVESMRLDSAGNLLLGTTSASTPGTGFVSAANTFGFKNRIINGAMVIDQRNAGASVTISTAGHFITDRWSANASQNSKYTAQQNAGAVTPPSGFINYLGATSSSAYSVLTGDVFWLAQAIEGLNIADLGWGAAGAQSVTLSFWVRSSLTGTFGGALRNSAGSRSYPFTYSILAANTWEQKTITIAGDTTGTWLTTNGIGINLNFGLGAGSTFSGTAGAWAAGNFVTATGATSVVATNGATFYITGVQLERGSAATSFDFRSIGTELGLCQRYCQKFNVFPTSSFDAFQSYFGGSNVLSSVKRLTTPMRATPTAAFTNAGVEYYSFGGAWTATTLNSSITTNEVYYIFCASDGDGRGKLMRNGGSGLNPDPVVTFSAEL